MAWKELLIKLLYALLVLIIPSLVVFIFKRVGEPISEYTVNRNIKIKIDEYEDIYNENEDLKKQVNKLQIIKKKKGSRE